MADYGEDDDYLMLRIQEDNAMAASSASSRSPYLICADCNKQKLVADCTVAGEYAWCKECLAEGLTLGEQKRVLEQLDRMEEEDPVSLEVLRRWLLIGAGLEKRSG